MKNYVIISEFNPFHKGHQYLIEQCRKHGATHITAVMSGNFVQRGDVAIVSKHSRVKMALKGGVDLVLELPLPYALSNAQNFARGGVQIADSMGCCDCLVFGSECGDTTILKQIADSMQNTKFHLFLKKEMQKGISYPNAVANTMKNFDSQYADILNMPNNVLAIEYIKALNEYHSIIIPVTFRRIGDDHNSSQIYSEVASASNIRNLILKHCDFRNFVPETSYDILRRCIRNGKIANMDNNMRAILYRLRNMSIEELSKITDIHEGLEYKIKKAIQQSVTFDEIIKNAKSKRYTYAGLRRILISAFLGITHFFSNQGVPYLRILGFNANGTEILKQMKNKATLPIVTKITNLPDIFSDFARAMLNLEIQSTDIYATFMQNIMPCGMEFINGIVID